MVLYRLKKKKKGGKQQIAPKSRIGPVCQDVLVLSISLCIATVSLTFVSCPVSGLSVQAGQG